jgi:chemotaxis protein histidine kinase CheA
MAPRRGRGRPSSIEREIGVSPRDVAKVASRRSTPVKAPRRGTIKTTSRGVRPPRGGTGSRTPVSNAAVIAAAKKREEEARRVAAAAKKAKAEKEARAAKEREDRAREAAKAKKIAEAKRAAEAKRIAEAKKDAARRRAIAQREEKKAAQERARAAKEAAEAKAAKERAQARAAKEAADKAAKERNRLRAAKEAEAKRVAQARRQAESERAAEAKLAAEAKRIADERRAAEEAAAKKAKEREEAKIPDRKSTRQSFTPDQLVERYNSSPASKDFNLSATYDPKTNTFTEDVSAFGFTGDQATKTYTPEEFMNKLGYVSNEYDKFSFDRPKNEQKFTANDLVERYNNSPGAKDFNLNATYDPATNTFIEDVSAFGFTGDDATKTYTPEEFIAKLGYKGDDYNTFSFVQPEQKQEAPPVEEAPVVKSPGPVTVVDPIKTEDPADPEPTPPDMPVSSTSDFLLNIPEMTGSWKTGDGGVYYETDEPVYDGTTTVWDRYDPETDTYYGRITGGFTGKMNEPTSKPASEMSEDFKQAWNQYSQQQNQPEPSPSPTPTAPSMPPTSEQPSPEPDPEPTPPPPPTFVDMDPLKGMREQFVPRNILGQSYDPQMREDFVNKMQSGANISRYPTYETPTSPLTQTQFGGYGQPMPMSPLAPYAGLGAPPIPPTDEDEPYDEDARPGGPSQPPRGGGVF